MPHSPSLSRIEVGHEWIHRCIRQWNRDHASGVRTRFCRPEHKYEKAVESKRSPPPSRYLEERFIGLVSFVSQRLRVLGDTRWLRRYSILEGRVYRASSMERMCVWKWRGPLLRIPAAKITAALNFNGGDDKYQELIAVFKLEQEQCIWDSFRFNGSVQRVELIQCRWLS